VPVLKECVFTIAPKPQLIELSKVDSLDKQVAKLTLNITELEKYIVQLERDLEGCR